MKAKNVYRTYGFFLLTQNFVYEKAKKLDDKTILINSPGISRFVNKIQVVMVPRTRQPLRYFRNTELQIKGGKSLFPSFALKKKYIYILY